MIIDFHSHSNASDGALPPFELVQQAIAAGVSRFAITDHDTVAGYRAVQARAAELPAGFDLCAGVELSCRWANDGVHVVGLGVDVDNPELQAGIERLATARQQRAVTIAERLARLGFAGALEGAQQQAGNSQIGRPHFAAWLVAAGHVADMNAAFDKYLGAGKTGDVRAYWPELAEVTGWIVTAGGVAVMAHPLKYRYTRSKLMRLLRQFMASGGRGIEVCSGRQTADQTAQLCRLAGDLGLLVSAGSDFHQQREYGAPLGVDVTAFANRPAVWSEI